MAIPPPRTGPAGQPVVGNLLDLRADYLNFLTSAARVHGDVALIRYGPRPVYLFSHPRDVEAVLVTHSRHFAKGYFYRFLHEVLGHGLLTSEGAGWLRQRRLLQPAFHRRQVAGYGATMVASTLGLLAGWDDGQERDVHADMMALTLQIVAKILLDADVVGDARDVGAALETALHETNALMNSPAFLLPGWVPTPGKWRLERAVRRLDAIVYRIIQDRRRAGDDAEDLLSTLLRLRDEDGGGMTDRQLRDEAMTIVLAGHETTALALSWAWYLLGHDPEAEGRLHEELDREVGGRPPTVTDLPRLPAVERVILEAMRLYPPIPAIGREATAPVEIGGYRLPAGTNVMVCQWVTHRDPRFFADPDAFRPDRWADGLAQRLPRGAYFPFAAGPRVCIGQPFALIEAQLILAAIAQQYRLILRPDHPVIPDPALTLRPKHGIRVRLERR